MKKFSLMAALPLAWLGSALGVAVAAALPVQNAPLVGCVGQPLENGVWRFIVTGQQAGVGGREGFWLVNLEATNLTPQVQDSVNIIDESRIAVTDSAGQVVRDGALVAIGGDAARLRLSPGETGTFTLMSRVGAAKTPWTKIIVPMKSGNPNLPFVAAPDLTIGLNCP
ncbi:hypothetical protein [Deinococcus alpinitundrae]|uniref:hypothetical protein n=1 Tax=Deinococcus alpinitundrae TaxID=468913 RepID=UPI0013795ECD|nr:hypothetical protein [Deinococcus alpinitundrae]